jgi:hypothetical protein
MKITELQFNQLRTAVSRMDSFQFMNTILRVCPDAIPYIEQFFDGCNPYEFLVLEQDIKPISLEDYRDYCVRWFDHVKKDMCV